MSGSDPDLAALDANYSVHGATYVGLLAALHNPTSAGAARLLRSLSNFVVE